MAWDYDLTAKLMDKKLYERLSPFIKEYSVSSETWKVVKCIGEYYKYYPSATAVTVADLKMFFFSLHSKTCKGDDFVLMNKYFDAVEDALKNPSPRVVEDVINRYVKIDYATRIANKSIAIAQETDPDTLDSVATMVRDYNKEVGLHVTRDDLFVPTDVSYVTEVCSRPGFNWRLNELNISVGPLRTGDFVIFAARPETGKTTMMASEAAFFATQLGTESRPIIWVNNEESSSKVMHRIMQAHFGVTNTMITADPKKYEEAFKAEIGSRIMVLRDDAKTNDVRTLDSIFAEYNPCAIIIDQLDKVNGFNKSEREDLRIGKLYEWARDKAKEYGPTIAVSQVDGSGEGQKWIVMNQLRGSKTDKIGEADAIITIGKSNDPSEEYNRYIHIPKNKLFGSATTEEKYRHGYFEVRIQPDIARYIGTF